MMHDFGVSLKHTIILDMPLSLDPLNLLRGVPVVSYNPKTPSRFGVFERSFPGDVRWFETPPCIIFHVGNTWSDMERQVVEMVIRSSIFSLFADMSIF